MSEPAAAVTALLLEVRGGGAIALAQSDALRRFLDLVLRDPRLLDLPPPVWQHRTDSPQEPQLRDLSPDDPEVQARPDERRALLRPLLPIEPATADPEWLRETELLEDMPACPGERLFTQSLLDAAQWWRAEEIAAAARALAVATASGAAIPATIPTAALLHGCEAVAAAAARLPEARQARLVLAAEP